MLLSPANRARLREAAGVTQARLAAALKSTQTVKNWENGRSEPCPPRLQAYLRLLDGWAERYAAPTASQSSPAPAPAAVPEAFTGPAEQPAEPATAATAAGVIGGRGVAAAAVVTAATAEVGLGRASAAAWRTVRCRDSRAVSNRRGGLPSPPPR